MVPEIGDTRLSNQKKRPESEFQRWGHDWLGFMILHMGKSDSYDESNVDLPGEKPQEEKTVIVE